MVSIVIHGVYSYQLLNNWKEAASSCGVSRLSGIEYWNGIVEWNTGMEYCLY